MRSGSSPADSSTLCSSGAYVARAAARRRSRRSAPSPASSLLAVILAGGIGLAGILPCLFASGREHRLRPAELGGPRARRVSARRRQRLGAARRAAVLHRRSGGAAGRRRRRRLGGADGDRGRDARARAAAVMVVHASARAATARATRPGSRTPRRGPGPVRLFAWRSHASEFFAIMSAFPTGVAIVTTLEPDGTPRGPDHERRHERSAEPPILLVSVDRHSRTLPALAHTKRFVDQLHARRLRRAVRAVRVEGRRQVLRRRLDAPVSAECRSCTRERWPMPSARRSKSSRSATTWSSPVCGRGGLAARAGRRADRVLPARVLERAVRASGRLSYEGREPVSCSCRSGRARDANGRSSGTATGPSSG